MCARLQKSKGGATIEAKPRIKKLGDVTKFMPVSLRVKRNAKDSTGRNIKSAREYRRAAGVCCCDVRNIVAPTWNVYEPLTISPRFLDGF